MISPTVRYAVRSVGRNMRRTSLAILGIAIGCALALVMESLNRGRDELFARMGTYSGSGHLRIVPAGWLERRDVKLRLAHDAGDLAAARALDGAAAVTTRARADVLLAMGTHVVAVEMVGVDPAREPATYRLVQRISQGRYLQSGETDAVVIGQSLARRLSAGVDDDLMASAVGPHGDIQSVMLRVVGIVSTGSEEIDASICQVAAADVAALTGLAGAGEVVVTLGDWRETDRARDRLASAIAPGDRVLTWGDINPDFKGHMQQDKAMSRVVSAIILLIVLLGVASAQLAAVLERRREFAVLAALGMRGGQMMTTLVVEAVAMGVLGGVIGLAIGLPLVWRLATAGFDMAPYVGSNYSAFGLVIEPIVYGDLGAWVAPYVLVIALVSTLAAAVYPVWFAVRVDPAAALRVAQ
jgi:ABC-type lipoprotein release transport system permease subunit